MQFSPGIVVFLNNPIEELPSRYKFKSSLGCKIPFICALYSIRTLLVCKITIVSLTMERANKAQRAGISFHTGRSVEFKNCLLRPIRHSFIYFEAVSPWEVEKTIVFGENQRPSTNDPWQIALTRIHPGCHGERVLSSIDTRFRDTT